jgi:hypothetical protein
MGSHSNGLEPEIREVWAENLEEEMAHIRDIVEDYPYIAMVPPCIIDHLTISLFLKVKSISCSPSQFASHPTIIVQNYIIILFNCND